MLLLWLCGDEDSSSDPRRLGERCPDGARGGMEMLMEEDDEDAFEEDPCFTASASFSDPLNGEGGGGADDDDRTPKTVRLTDGFDNNNLDVDDDDEATES